MEEKKINELNDEKLDEVTGGGVFVPPGLRKWCSRCGAMVAYRVVYEDRTTRYECLDCGNPVQ